MPIKTLSALVQFKHTNEITTLKCIPTKDEEESSSMLALEESFGEARA